ncbi:MAG: type II toxin-antitoxin system death-on-curing family toxin [Elusimicrobia bacterium]|jgi:death-on-curing protein|nr:type II toxin-antitoxin system death-on-curing family toxin [Elusimicrobiota bacterium]
MVGIKRITIKEVEVIAHKLARTRLQFDEPIPDFNLRFPNILESCLLVPFQTFSKKLLYKGLISKAAILFYLMIKNHPFQNGNIRIAMTALFVFLYKNGRWMSVNINDLYEFTMRIASSPAENKEEYLQIIKKFIKKHLT